MDSDASEPHRDAVLCMNSNLFWETWLLPVLQNINFVGQVQPLPALLLPHSDGLVYVTLIYSPGDCTTHPSFDDAYYKFKRNSDYSWEWMADPGLLHAVTTLNHEGTDWTVNEDSEYLISLFYF